MAQTSEKLNKEIIKKIELDYLLYLPEDYDKNSEKKWPLILFLHGAGERGNDIEKVRKHGIPKIVDSTSGFPFIAISPQCSDYGWERHAEELINLISDIEENYNVDEARIYVTGLSMGGYGTWDLAILYPDKFAAIAPICGGSIFPNMVGALKDQPIWAFHGAKDQVVPISETQGLVDHLKKLGNNVRFSIYPEANHDSWTETYNNPELYEWFLKHSKLS